VLDHKFTVADLLSSLQSPLAQPHSGLQLVVVNSIPTKQEEKVLLVALTCLTFHIPIVLSGHFVFIFHVFFIVNTLRHVFCPLCHGLICRQEVGNKLFSRFVHHSSDHSLTHLLVLKSRCDTRRSGVRVKDDLGTWILIISPAYRRTLETGVSVSDVMMMDLTH